MSYKRGKLTTVERLMWYECDYGDYRKESHFGERGSIETRNVFERPI